MSSEIYTPSPWGARYHDTTADEVLGGGSAGPGKTACLIADPLKQIVTEHNRTRLPKDHPDYLEPGMSKGWALYLRRLNVTLDQIILRAKRMYQQIDPSIHWDAEHSTMVFPRCGYRYQFGHCKDPNDWERYFSNEYTELMLDEANQFLEVQYDWLTTRVRTDDHVLMNMLKIRLMSNPVVQLEEQSVVIRDPFWLRRLFVDPYKRRGLYPWCGRDNPETGKKGVVLTKKVTRGDGSVAKTTRLYLPAWLSDNPNKAFRDSFERQLLTKKPHVRRALIGGDWYSTASGFYADSWIESMHICQPFQIPDEWPVFRAMDWGFKKHGCIYWAALDPEGTLYVFREYTFRGRSATQVAERVKEIEKDEGLWKKGRSIVHGPADTQLWEARGDSGLSKAEEFAKVGVMWVPADKRSRARNAERLLIRLDDHDNGSTTPGIVFFSSCERAIGTIPAIPTSPGNPDEPMDGGEDHWHDAILYLCSYVSRRDAWQRPNQGDEEFDEDFDDDAPPRQRGYDGYGGTA